MKTLIKKMGLMLCIVLASVIIVQEKSVSAENEPYIDYIEVKEYEWFIKSYPPAIGCYPASFYTVVHMSDGTVATDKSYTNMDWKVERYDNVSKTYTTVEVGEGEEMSFWMPYGTLPGQYKITATSKKEPDVSGYTWYQLYHFSLLRTFCICKPGKIKYGTITGRKPDERDISETYDWNTEKYTSILPKCTYNAKDYTFVGWEKDGKIYKPGEKYVAGYEDEPDHRNAYFVAKWERNFKKPNLVAYKAGKNKINLKWDRMIGAQGYKIYRATKKNGKYTLIGIEKDEWDAVWTDKNIKSGQTYYYKVAAYKKSKGKISQKKSEWAMASTKAAKVKSVKLNKTSIKGKAGQSTSIKATVKTAKGERLSKTVRWYTSDKKIAKVNQKTGKITFVKAGTCKVWAKSYSGKNSPKVKVVVES